MTDEQHREYERLIAMFNRRRHAVEFARDTPDDLKAMERGTAEEWAKSMRETFSIEVSNVQLNPDPNAAPDCFAQCRGQSISVELTELVNCEVLRKIKAIEKTGRTASLGEWYDEAQWSAGSLAAQINRQLDRKQAKYAGRSPAIHIDAIVIHTAEPWLPPALIEETIASTRFEPRKNMRSAYLLRSYFPGYAEHWPLFNLYGSVQ